MTSISLSALVAFQSVVLLPKPKYRRPLHFARQVNYPACKRTSMSLPAKIDNLDLRVKRLEDEIHAPLVEQ